MTTAVWWRTMKTSVLWFILLSLLAFTLAVAAFAYGFDKYLQTGKVLGVQIQNNSSGLSLFSNQVRLVKLAGAPTIYAIVGNFKYPVRNEEVFYSYDYNFRNVRAVSAAELARYPLARLVKERGTGRTYFLNYDNNLKKHHLTPSAFAAYPNNRWADAVELSGKDLSFWEDAVLLKEVSSARVYYVSGSQKAWVPSENEFLNAGFSWSKILTVNQVDLDTYQTVNFNIDLTRGGGQSATPSAAKQVIVTLDSSSPAASILPCATAGNLAAVFRFQALAESVNITGLKLTKSGLLDINKITAVRVEDENGVEFATSANIINNAININFIRGPVVVSRAAPKILRIKLSFAPGQEVNHSVSLGVQSASDVLADATVSGIFPLFAASHRLIAADNLIGQVRISSQTINNTLRDVNLGSRNETAAKFIIEETSGNERAVISSLTFTNFGTANDNSIENISLYKDRTLISAVRYLQNRKATFNLSNNNITVIKDSPVEISLKIDVLQGEGETLKFVINSADDVQAKGLTQGFNLTVTSAGFPIGQGAGDNYNRIAFRRAGIGFFASQLTDGEREIFRGQADTIFAQFELRNAEQDLYLQRLKLQVEKFNGAPDIADNISIMEKTSRQVIVTIDKERVRGGVTADVNLGNYKVAANAAQVLWIVAKVPDNSQSNNSYRINIPELSYKIGLDNTMYTQAVAAAGQLMLVYAPRLAVTSGSLANGGAAVAGADRIELGNFNLAAAVDEQIKITNIVMSLATSSDDVTYAAGFSELALYAGGRVSAVITRPNSRTYTFTNLNLVIRAGASLNLTINADTENITAGKKAQFKLESLQAEGYSSRAPVNVTGEGTISDAVEINAAGGG